MTWEAKVRSAPQSPGVYIMKDGEGRPLYVGKAKAIRRRVRAYLDPERHGPKNRMLLAKVRDIEFIVTDNETEALVLENSLIKSWKPRYNISLRDDKTYPFIRLSVQDEYPTLTVVRRPARDGARYFGPYVPAGAMRRTLELLQGIFPLRRCRSRDVSGRKPCLNLQMGKCLGPCTGKVRTEEYHQLVDGVTLFLQGKGMSLASDLRKKMKDLSRQEKYEEAARLRDMALAVEATLKRQHVHLAERGDMDVFGTAVRGGTTALAVLQLRGGRIIGSTAYTIDESRSEEKEEHLVAELVRAYYASAATVPPLVLLPASAEGQGALQEWLCSLAGSSRVHLRVPVRGELRSLVAMASRNALNEIERAGSYREERAAALRGVAVRAGWRGPAASVAAVDASNAGGKDTVASIVWWEDGSFRKKEYRHLRIDDVPAGDDYAAIGSAVNRMMRRIAAGEWRCPDVLLVDGGRGQLRAADRAVGRDGGGPGLVLAIAKPQEGRGADRIYAAGRRNALGLEESSQELRLLQSIRDEAHRFAVAYHRKRRSRHSRRSILEDIPGVGAARRRMLLSAFGSLKRLEKAPLEDLLQVRGIPRSVAEAVFRALQGPHPGGD